jgi:hypothetical protein
VDEQEQKRIRSEFADAVNMTATELKDWLGTEQSRSVGDSGGQGESTGHRMGRTITGLLGAKAAELDDADLQKMRKVTGYVHRHLAQRPEGDVTDTPWRYSLMNWGHDPLK